MSPEMNLAEKTVLVVDDDLTMREGLADLLRHQGYRVLTAADGEEGFQAVQAQRPDLVVLDVVMPKLDGFRVATMIKGDPTLRHIPVILYSGHVEESGAIRAYETQAEYFVPKAGNLRPILKAIRDLLEGTPP
ncbi:MAG: response regulator [candidate division NC10 bacterium]|nr:response regulator [candidate division NC10 bacterium]